MNIWLNGAIVKEEEATISPFDHGYLYGLGVFETFRTYDGHPFLLGDHLERLHQSLEEMEIQFELKVEDATRLVRELQTANGGEDGYFRLNVSAGVRQVGLFPEPYEKPTVMLLQKTLPTQLTGGKSGQWLSTPRNTPETATRLKSHHYFNNIAGRREIANGVVIEGVFLTKEGYVAEGVTSNIFWVSQDCLYTPALSTGILAGVTRKMVLAIAGDLGLSIKEGLYTKDTVMAADEVFVTNSVQEIVPIHSIEDSGFAGFDGKWTTAIHQRYRKYNHSLLRVEERSIL
ncbi:aminodeoxychorismate lyase [Jeotgalibacillus marinus]|uniref:Aminodeoxychorismate lyase n=1 Tax=Jeotgalibacillus marinus TaxID=86667 RepID=A0ABV3Q6E6_9BACL